MTHTLSKKPKLAMTLLARDEGDIIRQNIEFHLHYGVDFIIATDNGSTDNTRSIFAEYQGKGKLHLIDEPGRDYLQEKWNNRMAKIAYEQYGADIIFHCDADEFWHPRDGNLKSEIWSSAADYLTVNLANVLLEYNDGKESFPEDTKFAVINPVETNNLQEDSKNQNLYFFRYPPKVIFKTNKILFEVSMGNHLIVNADDTISSKASERITIYHFPMRGKKIFYQKVIETGKAFENNITLEKDGGWHVKRWYSAYNNGNLDKEYKKLTVTKEEGGKKLRAGMVKAFDFKKFLAESMDDGWAYYHPEFEYEHMFNDTEWPWVGHKNFAYDLITNLKPKRIVELGTHRGTSLFTFCQAVKNNFLETEVFAVDTWTGDEHTGFYGENVLQTVNDIIGTCYSGLNITLLQKNFDNAISDFEDNSIDLLHIDGLHTYEAVKHDFESWLPKMKGNGIILLHDINVSENDFGVYRLWDDLKKQYKTVEFYHSFGLGVLFVSNESARRLLKFQKEWQMHYSYLYEMMMRLAIQLREREIESMKTSKFWKLRNVYVKIRTLLRL